MHEFLGQIHIKVNEKVYLKDPLSSELGREILTGALPLIESIGLEGFTFRKLSTEIQTTESAIYRYFESKHKLLLYYVSWYWGLMEYNFVFATANIPSPRERMEAAVRTITGDIPPAPSMPFDLQCLQRVVVAESAKAYLTKDVDAENRDGLFQPFKSLCRRISSVVSEIAPDYPYAHSLASLFIESHLNQLYFNAHLPSLCDLKGGQDERFDFFKSMIFGTIAPWQK